MELKQRTHWIFDMDGTLTVAIHDFEAIRATLGLPSGRPILESIAALPEAQAAPLRRRLAEIEVELARRSTAQPGASELLLGLQQQGVRLGLLTRNSRQNAVKTLQACGLWHFFEPDCVLGREASAPKPSPDGIHKLLDYWDVPPGAAVMVGDYHFDLEAGRRAGTATVYVDVGNNGYWSTQADWRVQNLGQLLALATG